MQVIPPPELPPGKILVPCTYCEKQRPRWRSRLKRQKFFFCNRKCFDKWSAMPETKKMLKQLAQEGLWRAMEERVEASYQLTKGQDEFKRRNTSQ